ncbi:MAG: cold shock domain-containing protein [Oliverpabstia sp.]|nr:cold shock domain-containing protein [Oliverpabstia sp.]
MKNKEMEILIDDKNRYIGYVVKFKPEKGFGFIKNRSDGECYFVHISQIVGHDSLNVGDTVEFSIGFNKRADKEQAEKVLVIENK